jgi:hypothetical protein
VADPPTLARILAWFRDFAARNSDGESPQLAYVVTTFRAAQSLFDRGSSSNIEDPERPVVVAVAYGHIAGYAAKGPWPRRGDGRPPSGVMLYAVSDASDGGVMLWGISKEPLDLAPLGPAAPVPPSDVDRT